MTFWERITNLMQARIGWSKAEAYATDVVEYMKRQGFTVYDKNGVLVKLSD